MSQIYFWEADISSTNQVIQRYLQNTKVHYCLEYNSNKMHKSRSLFYLTPALHVSGVTINHLQEHKTTVTTASGNRYTVLLSAAIVEELELIWVCCSNSSTTAADNRTGMYIIHYSIELIAFSAEYTLFNNCNFNLVYRHSLSVNLSLSVTV